MECGTHKPCRPCLHNSVFEHAEDLLRNLVISNCVIRYALFQIDLCKKKEKTHLSGRTYSWREHTKSPFRKPALRRTMKNLILALPVCVNDLVNESSSWIFDFNRDV